MFHFFSKLRRKFAFEGQLMQYARYAIGEIVLIVIGIMVALQINNWNEYKQERQMECQYLSNLLTDIERQSAEIDDQMDAEKVVVDHGERLIEAFNKNQGFVIDSAFSFDLSILNNRKTFQKTDAAYRDLVSSGKLSILSDDSLKVHILRYFEGLENTSQVLDRNNQVIDNQFAPMALGMATHHMPYSQQGFMQKVIESDIVEKEHYPVLADEENILAYLQTRSNTYEQKLRLINEIQYRYRISIVHLFMLQLLKEETAALKIALDEAIENCN